MTRIQDSSAIDKSSVETILARMAENTSNSALFWQGREYTYSDLFVLIGEWEVHLREAGFRPGSVCAFLGDFSPQTSALMFALIKIQAILLPLTDDVLSEMDSYLDIAGAVGLYRFDQDDNWTLEKRETKYVPPLIGSFLDRQHAGLIVFTSGSTGAPKGILHDCEYVMSKFVSPRRGWKTVLFLLMDHFGGFNTFLSTFAYSGMGVCPEKRTPEAVAKAIQMTQADLLPATPTFLNLIIASKLYKTYDFSSVEMITYGTEVMSETTLHKVNEIFPKAKLKQTYGLSEQGVLHSKSEKKDTTWVKIGGPGFETKVVDGILWLRSKSNMVGYLNAPDPFDKDGWLCTGDQVDVKGEYLRFLGRKSEMINIGGKKVFPLEVENVLLQAPNIRDASVFAKDHLLMGQVVHAQVSVIDPEGALELSERLRKFCNDRLAKYKVPLRFALLSDEKLHNARFKKVRKESVPPDSIEAS